MPSAASPRVRARGLLRLSQALALAVSALLMGLDLLMGLALSGSPGEAEKGFSVAELGPNLARSRLGYQFNFGPLLN